METKQILCVYGLKLFLCLRYYFDLAIDALFGLYYCKKQESVPPTSDPLLLQSAQQLAQSIRNRKLTCQQVVQTFINRIKEVNPIINAVVDERFSEALKEATAIDDAISIGNIMETDFDNKPLLGIPFTTKESVACKGMAFTFGLKKRKGHKAHFDADCVELMKKAGAILVGVTNIPQLNLWQETSNPIYGLTKNPYNTSRNVGGSSGGEASIIASCGSPIGIGTDIGGSSRIPAFMCGLFGHKPTCNIIPIKGLTFRTGQEEDSMVVCGPITKNVADLILCLKVLAGPKRVQKLNLDEPVAIKDLKVYYVSNPRDIFVSPFRGETKYFFNRAIEMFKEVCETKPSELQFEDLKYTTKLWKYWMTQEGTNFKHDINNREGEINSIVEIVKHFTIGGDFTTATIYNLINGLMKKVNEKWAKQTTEQLKKAILSKLDNNSVLIYPSAPFPASYHYTAFLRPYNFNLFSIWNVLKLPVTQVPLGLGKDGLPMGIQVVAAPFQDRLCIAVAKELEQHFGGFKEP
ncbi:fatty-acid amide hydrolase 2-like [Rhynchophorus ferrugineus]|uniref:fatty-acid amide hydrolase 2-like n=1 Tax=Rhynchophorus ferrugineus TaxID=354439 RepID=UPI003FCC81AF